MGSIANAADGRTPNRADRVCRLTQAHTGFHTCMILELSGKTEMEGHVCGKDCTDDQLSNLLHCTPATLSNCFYNDSCLRATACPACLNSCCSRHRLEPPGIVCSPIGCRCQFSNLSVHLLTRSSCGPGHGRLTQPNPLSNPPQRPLSWGCLRQVSSMHCS